MRFMMIVKASKESEAGVMPSQELINAMMKYNEELVKAGVLLDAGGLHPSSTAVRVTWPGGKPKATDGPFTETKELIAGFWIIQVKSKDEAIEWAMRIPNPDGDEEAHIELRQFFETPELTDDAETVRKEAELVEQVEKYKRS
jgi:hypothetical protein